MADGPPAPTFGGCSKPKSRGIVTERGKVALGGRGRSTKFEIGNRPRHAKAGRVLRHHKRLDGGCVLSQSVFGYGTTELSGTIPPRADTHFRAASNTKTMTAAVIVLLVQEGKLRFDDPISKYVQGVPNGDKITISELLRMRSGLDLLPVINAIRAEGITSATGIARALNQRGIPTTRGARWHAVQVQRVLRKASGYYSSNLTADAGIHPPVSDGGCSRCCQTRSPLMSRPGNDGRPGDNGPHWRWSQDAAVTPYSGEGAVDIPMAYQAPRFNARRRWLLRRSAQAR
jgi:hypothetical protein